MKPLRNLPALLSKHETHRFMAWLHPPRKPEKMLSLFRLLRTHRAKKLTAELKHEMEKKIYKARLRHSTVGLYPAERGIYRKGKKVAEKSFDMLNYRLNKKILDFFTSEAFANNHPVLETLHAAQLEIKRKWAQHYILNFTGRTGHLANSLLDEAINTARNYEYYHDLSKLLRIRQIDRAYSYGEREMNKYTAEIKRCEKCARAVHRAYEIYYRVLIWEKFHSNLNSSPLLKILKRGIKELKKAYAQTHAAETLYFLRYLETEYYQKLQQYDIAFEKCIKIMEAIKHPAVFTRPRQDYAFASLAQIYIYMGNYADAFDMLEGMKYIIHQPRDWAETREIQVRILFYAGKYKEAKRLIEQIRKRLPEDAEPIRIGRLELYEICLWYKQNNLKAVKGALQKKLIVQKDKTGWGISLRMLEVMLLAEEKNHSACLRMAKRLKKFMALTNNTVAKRDLLMADLLQAMAEKNFNRTSCRVQFQKTYTLLSKTKGEYAWDPMSHEILKYNEWLKKIAA